MGFNGKNIFSYNKMTETTRLLLVLGFYILLILGFGALAKNVLPRFSPTTPPAVAQLIGYGLGVIISSLLWGAYGAQYVYQINDTM